MDQLSMFDNDISFPLTHEDVVALYEKYIREGETDPDVFTFSDIAKGKSYKFYGEKVFEHRPGTLKTARLCLAVEDEDGSKKFPVRKASDFTPDQLLAIMEDLKRKMQELFLTLNVEKFGCCNDFIACSDARMCLHQDDRFYNGCYYRKNLEAGRIFYGKNKNI